VREDRILDEQLEYYDSRASTYDQVYAREGRHDQGHDANECWLSDLREIEARLAGAQLTGQVLELGCGTGYWTRHLAATAERVTAVDGSERMLEAARQRLEGNSALEFQRTDLVRDWEVGNSYDAVAAFFFLEHVSDAHVDDIVHRVS
jgi:2-polyprenyl-3-methyl-5-hydroxy-6-metoxy-1,4-benzoquinol methylase